MADKQKHLAIIAKPTHGCNFRCKYCYLEDTAESGVMSESTLDTSLSRVADFSDSSHWIWHGGEPLLMGVDFFRLVKDMQDFYSEKKGVHFDNGIQSNASLITPELVRFLEETKDFHIGSSLDGPAELHNQTRIYADGRGTFEDVMKGLRTLSPASGGAGVICVVNGRNVDHPKEIYEFFRDNNLSVKFNSLIHSGRARENEEELGITPKQFGNFLLKLWDVYNADCLEKGEVTIDLDPFMEIIGNLEVGRSRGCNYSSSCRGNFISIGPQGDIYPCGRFDGIPEFHMGNVHKHTIEEASKSPIEIKLKGRKLEDVASCKGCDIGKTCNSGCMHNAYLAGDVMGKDPYCISNKMLSAKMGEVLNEEKQRVEAAA